jgi:tetratricopeptide (TPR) repeat protein
MSYEKRKNVRRWSSRIIEMLIVITAIGVAIQFFAAQNVSTPPQPEPVVVVQNTEPVMDAEALYWASVEAMNDGDYSGARALITSAIEAHESPPETYYWRRAWLLGQEHRHEEAIEAYQNLLASAGNQAYAFAGLCYNYGSLAEFDTAEQYCAKAGEFQSHTQHSINNMCYIHSFTGPYEQSVRECNSWVRSDSSHPYAYNNRSRAYLMLGNYVQTIEDATRALELNTDYPEMPYTNRGLAKLAMGDYVSGYGDLMAALGADPTYPDIYLGLGMYHDAMGNIAEAQQNYCHYLATAWDSPSDIVVVRINEIGSCSR